MRGWTRGLLALLLAISRALPTHQHQREKKLTAFPSDDDPRRVDPRSAKVDNRNSKHMGARTHKPANHAREHTRTHGHTQDAEVSATRTALSPRSKREYLATKHNATRREANAEAVWFVQPAATVGPLHGDARRWCDAMINNPVVIVGSSNPNTTKNKRARGGWFVWCVCLLTALKRSNASGPQYYFSKGGGVGGFTRTQQQGFLK